MRINPGMKPKEPTYQVVLDALALTICYHVFVITAEVPVLGKAFDEPPTEEEALSFIRELGHTIEIKYITDVIVDHLHQPWRIFASIINKCLCGKIDNIDSNKQDKMFYPRSTKIIIHHFLKKDKSISMRNIMFMHTARDDSLLGIMRFVSRHAYTQVYDAILPQAMMNQALLDYVAYKTYYATTSGYTKAKKVVAPKPKPTKKKTLVKADRGKGLNVLSEVALFEAAQFKDVTKRSKKDFHISHASGSSDGTNFESRVPNDEKESWGDSGEEDEDDENDSEDKSDDGDDDDDGNDGNDDDDANDDDNQEGDDTNDDDEETNKEEEKIDDEEMMDDEEDDEVTNKLYKDVNVNLGNKDTEMTDADQGFSEQQNVSQESRFEKVKEDYHVTLTLNPSPADNKIASLMGTLSRHTTEVPEITSSFTTTIPPPPSFFNPLSQQATPTLTPTTSEATTSFPSLLDFSYVFKFNNKVTNLKKDLSEIKQVDQYTQSPLFLL
ncbi:hypothetical protein Tco_1561236 [Tanacetum coccineum]